jgi:hypothetical protein
MRFKSAAQRRAMFARLKQPRKTRYTAEVSTDLEDDETSYQTPSGLTQGSMPYVIFANDKRALRKRISRFKKDLPYGSCKGVNIIEDVYPKSRLRRVGHGWKEVAKPSSIPKVTK